ncbi:hypothetical protein KIN20_020266 [Parelaphostrongylus tenuis]|uniref:Uncharacterized protein n=1 Tax=Parelaphostrongylus tenuis TaxID=148309 RepID=A0AAD5QTI8_PARTN|nr:hypothetical protein KIN20_020266 [Parelaphostrongylus tenuis]
MMLHTYLGEWSGEQEYDLRRESNPRFVHNGVRLPFDLVFLLATQFSWKPTVLIVGSVPATPLETSRTQSYRDGNVPGSDQRKLDFGQLFNSSHICVALGLLFPEENKPSSSTPTSRATFITFVCAQLLWLV